MNKNEAIRELNRMKKTHSTGDAYDVGYNDAIALAIVFIEALREHHDDEFRPAKYEHQ